MVVQGIWPLTYMVVQGCTYLPSCISTTHKNKDVPETRVDRLTYNALCGFPFVFDSNRYLLLMTHIDYAQNPFTDNFVLCSPGANIGEITALYCLGIRRAEVVRAQSQPAGSRIVSVQSPASSRQDSTDLWPK